MNPLDLFYSVPAVVVAFGAYMWTQVAKTAVDIAYKKAGKDRKENVWITRFLLPMVPPVSGAIIAALIPLHPDSLLAYVEANGAEWSKVNELSVFAAWGAACGQLSDYLYSKVKAAVQAVKVKADG